MQRIGIDCRLASTISGLGSYTRQLTQALAKRSDPWSYVLFVRSPAEPWLRALAQGKCGIVAAPERHYSIAEQCTLPRRLRAEGIDLLLAPHFNVPIAFRGAFVCTVHDLALHRFPNDARLIRRIGYSLVLGSALKRAAMVIACSHFTQAELLRTYGPALQTKVRVIYQGISAAFSPRAPGERERVRTLFHLPQDFLLYVGNAKQHKNVQMLIDAFASLGEPSLSLVLVCSGREARSLRLADRVKRIEAVSEDQLAALYSAARGFVSASLYEGFGRPMVEAMTCGCPVIATRSASVPEICGEAATLVEPTLEGLVLGMRTLLAGDARARALQGLERAASFDWGRAAALHAEALGMLLARNREHATL